MGGGDAVSPGDQFFDPRPLLLAPLGVADRQGKRAWAK